MGFPPEVIVLALWWYLRYGLSYRDVEELLAERGIEVDHVTIFRWVQRFTPLLADVVTDRAATLRAAINELMPAAFHNTEQHANNRIVCDHGRLKARLRPMRGLKRHCTASVIVRGHALIQNIRRDHYELGVDAHAGCRVAAALTELAHTI
jgi:transposase, IS6 family